MLWVLVELLLQKINGDILLCSHFVSIVFVEDYQIKRRYFLVNKRYVYYFSNKAHGIIFSII